MADIDRIIPFILRFEAGVRPKAGEGAEELFDRARRYGWSDDPLDTGGATMCGVTIGTYRDYCRRKGYPSPTKERLKEIPFRQWREILHTLYWDRWKADGIRSQALANILVDWVWASGVNGIKIPQRILGVTADGIVGQKTLAALNGADASALFGQIRAARINFCEDIVRRRPSQRKWLNGWLNRIKAINPDGTFAL